MTRVARVRGGASGREEGFVMVIVVLLVMIGLMIAMAGLAETLDTRTTANRQERSSRALQAADAGMETELYRANQLNLSTLKLTSGLSLSSTVSQLLTCPVPQVNSSGQVLGIQYTAIAAVGNPCPTNSSSGISSPGPNEEPVGHHDYFQAQFIPGFTNIGDFIQFNPEIVVSGVDDNGNSSDPQRYVSRRVEAILATVAPWRTLEAGHNLQIDVPPLVSALGVKLAGTTTFNGTGAANNNLTIDGQAALANAFVAANAGGSSLTEPSALDSCNTPTETNVTVTLTLGSVHSVSPCAGLVNRSTVSISPSKADCAPNTGTVLCGTLLGSSYVASTDSVFCASSCPVLTLQPGDYVFCDFEYNGVVDMNADSTHAVRVFIDSPSSSRCPGNGATHSSGSVGSFKTTYGNFITPHGVSNVLGGAHPSQAQVYVVGNGSNDGTTAYVTGDTTISSVDMFLYAPTSNMTVTGGQTCVLGTCVNSGTLAGAFVGYDVDASATTITQDLGLLNYPLSSTLGPFHVKQYIECSPQYPLSLTNPASGC